jgi:hypothetical protein
MAQPLLRGLRLFDNRTPGEYCDDPHPCTNLQRKSCTQEVRAAPFGNLKPRRCRPWEYGGGIVLAVRPLSTHQGEPRFGQKHPLWL